MLHPSPTFSSYSVHSSDRSASSNTWPPAAFTVHPPSPGVHRTTSQPRHSKHTTGTLRGTEKDGNMRDRTGHAPLAAVLRCVWTRHLSEERQRACARCSRPARERSFASKSVNELAPGAAGRRASALLHLGASMARKHPPVCTFFTSTTLRLHGRPPLKKVNYSGWLVRLWCLLVRARRLCYAPRSSRCPCRPASRAPPRR